MDIALIERLAANEHVNAALYAYRTASHADQAEVIRAYKAAIAEVLEQSMLDSAVDAWYKRAMAAEQALDDYQRVLAGVRAFLLGTAPIP